MLSAYHTQGKPWLSFPVGFLINTLFSLAFYPLDISSSPVLECRVCHSFLVVCALAASRCIVLAKHPVGHTAGMSLRCHLFSGTHFFHHCNRGYSPLLPFPSPFPGSLKNQYKNLCEYNHKMYNIITMESMLTGGVPLPFKNNPAGFRFPLSFTT